MVTTRAVRVARGGAVLARGGARGGARRWDARAVPRRRRNARATTIEDEATASVTSVSEFRVYIEHTDGYGVVFYAR